MLQDSDLVLGFSSSGAFEEQLLLEAVCLDRSFRLDRGWEWAGRR